MKKFFTLIFGALSFSMAKAQLIENFSYTSTGTTAADTLTSTALGGNLWKRHSGTGGPITWSASGLTYAGYAGSGVGGAVSFAHASGSREDANIAVSDITSGSVYASFLINVSVSGGTTGDYGLHFLAGNGTTTAGSDFKARFFFKDGGSANTVKFGLSKGSAGGSAVFTTTDYNIGQTYLVVMKYTFNASTLDDVASAYIFTSGIPATEPTSADLVATDMTIADIAKVAGFAIRQGTVGTGAATVDGLRIATGWNNAPLPATFNNFSGSLVGNTASLNWSVANEVNVNGYTIEKSTDGINFNALGFVAAKNAASATYSYNEVVNGLSHYRIKVQDKDGKYAYSKTITINPKKSIKLEVFPNPTVSSLTIAHEKATATTVVKITTIDGKIVLSKNLQEGAIQSTLDVSKLFAGTYVLVIEQGSTTSATQFVKQ